MPKQWRYFGLVLLFSALVGLFAVLSTTHGSPTPLRSTFTFPQDGEPVVVLTSKATQLPVTVSLSVYASGSAVLTSSLRSQRDDLLLAETDLESMLREVVEGGLVLYDEGVVEGEARRLSDGRIVGNSPDSDHPGFSVTFRVLEEPSSGAEVVEHSKTILVYGPERLARRFPTIRAYRALANLERILTSQISDSRGLR